MIQALSFDDVLLVPKRTFGGSRDRVSLSTELCGETLTIPILSANMSSITETDMCTEMYTFGGMGVIHRMCSADDQANMFHKLNKLLVSAYFSVEGTDSGIKRIHELKTKCGTIDKFCIDVAHADSPDVEETVMEIFRVWPDSRLIIGNYSTTEAIENILTTINNISPRLSSRTSFKIGIGSGSQCTTRVVTGCGLPTLESIFRIHKRFPRLNLIADGGIKNSGDIVKVLAAGANSVMLGHLLAGCKETPGNVIKDNGKLFKVYRGSASFGQKFEVNKSGYVEGEETLVPYKGHVTTILTQLVEGVRSGFSYCGSFDINELQNNAEFVQISNAGYIEGTAHGA